MDSLTSLTKINIDFIKQGREVLRSISDDIYVKVDGRYYQSGIGIHMRHVLDHYSNLFAQWKCGCINYDERERGTNIETNRGKAIDKCSELIALLQSLPEEAEIQQQDANVSLKILTAKKGIPEPTTGTSTLKRELLFLISHTVHHYALIGFILKIQGQHPPESFGVAPSTLAYQEESQTSL